MKARYESQYSPRVKRRFFLRMAVSVTASIILYNCTTEQKQSSGNIMANTAANTSLFFQNKSTLKLGVLAVVSEEVLKFIQDNFAANAGLDIQLVKFSDLVQPNAALKDGQIDANFFQHSPFMHTASKQLNLNLVMLNRVFLTPMGIYSKKFKTLAEITPNSTIAIYSDATNADRCLRLMATSGLIQFKDNVGEGLVGIKDISASPKNLQIKELEGSAVVRSLDDIDLAVFSAALRLQAGSDLQALVQESAAETRYAVGLVTLQGKENSPGIQKLNQLIHDRKVRNFIEDKYQGSVLPVF